MDQQQLIIALAVVIVVVIALDGFMLMRKRRSETLRERFGPEYDRVVKKEGDVRRGEDVLAFRTKRRDQLKIRPLSREDHRDFSSAGASSSFSSWMTPKDRSPGRTSL